MTKLIISKFKNIWKNNTLTITSGAIGVGIVVVFFSIFFSLFKITTISGKSMLPTLTPGQVTLVKITKNIKKNDIVFFKHQNTILVKRVIAVEGDHLVINDNTLFVNGKKVETLDKNSPTKNLDVIIKKDQFYALGDNLPESFDSRQFGIFSVYDIIGVKP